MDVIERQARELLAAESDGYAKWGILNLPMEQLLPDLQSALRAIAGASMPPVGYVLVPVELLRRVVGCTYAVSNEIDARGYAWSEAYLDEVLPQIRQVLLAARPEMP